ncbi:hypothetical protein MIND_00561800 [Mycena indigotica]|uniref:Uncharacterized protein n=1 Tax=Mycena indigotica TaxID=2126181 RepID=A0A8H6SRE4_9AGAR|nr:uncharacterized protein MIND_00561800 [Mycena indigotica]KAF7303341.1 hypothetical protein MIND_00561800 [Mycena indigotica]
MMPATLSPGPHFLPFVESPTLFQQDYFIPQSESTTNVFQPRSVAPLSDAEWDAFLGNIGLQSSSAAEDNVPMPTATETFTAGYSNANFNQPQYAPLDFYQPHPQPVDYRLPSYPSPSPPVMGDPDSPTHGQKRKALKDSVDDGQEAPSTEEMPTGKRVRPDRTRNAPARADADWASPKPKGDTTPPPRGPSKRGLIFAIDASKLLITLVPVARALAAMRVSLVLLALSCSERSAAARAFAPRASPGPADPVPAYTPRFHCPAQVEFHLWANIVPDDRTAGTLYCTHPDGTPQPAVRSSQKTPPPPAPGTTRRRAPARLPGSTGLTAAARTRAQRATRSARRSTRCASSPAKNKPTLLSALGRHLRWALGSGSLRRHRGVREKKRKAVTVPCESSSRHGCDDDLHMDVAKTSVYRPVVHSFPPAMPRCGFCKAQIATKPGLALHQTQNKRCLSIQERHFQQDKNHGFDDLPGLDPNIEEPMDVDSIPEQESLSDREEPPLRRPRMEDVPDDTTNDPISSYDPRYLHRQQYPSEHKAGRGQWYEGTPFEEWYEGKLSSGEQACSPFPSLEDWDIGRWLIRSGLSQGSIDEFLHLKKASPRQACPAFWDESSILETFKGDELDGDGRAKVEVLELWHRDPLECIAELLGNPNFKKEQTFKPMRLFRTRDQSTGELGNREYDEMWTGTWWWDTQDLLDDGATIVPVILSSDKTQLSSFAGDKQAWPVYISIGNISKSIRRQPNSRATVLLGYIPVPKLDCYSKGARKMAAYQVFHDCMCKMLDKLVEAGRDGVDIVCADGWARWCFPLPAAYIADYPEQCLVVCCQENSCPRCSCPPKERGSTTNFPMRSQVETLKVLEEQATGLKPKEFSDLNLRPIDPFWADLPHCDIHSCITPDLLHQLHKGVFADHVSSWAAESMEVTEEERKKKLDARFKAMPRHPTLRHFANGTSVIKQWTGSEYRGLAKTFLGAVHEAVDDRVTSVTRHLLDFMGYAHFQVHTDESLVAMQAAWEKMHHNLPVFRELGPERNDFNIPKLHNIRHYVDSIRLLGMADGYNTENTERLHIDLAKNGYRASNRWDYIQQMTRWLTRQEAAHRFSLYLQWACPGYTPGHGYGPPTDEDSPETITYNIAARPGYPNLSAAEVETRFHVRDFVFYLQKFLGDENIIVEGPITSATRFGAFKRVALQLPLILQGSISNKGIKRGSAAKFSTFLVRVKPRDWTEGPLSGLQAAQVKLIFRLPPSISKYEHPLVYVHWFTQFRNPLNDFDTASGLSRISHSTTVGQRRASIISLADVVQTCHLFPRFSNATNPDWNSSDILNQATVFYLNPYLRHRDFFFFRYSMYLISEYHKRKDAELAATLARGANRINY